MKVNLTVKWFTNYSWIWSHSTSIDFCRLHNYICQHLLALLKLATFHVFVYKNSNASLWIFIITEAKHVFHFSYFTCMHWSGTFWNSLFLRIDVHALRPVTAFSSCPLPLTYTFSMSVPAYLQTKVLMLSHKNYLHIICFFNIIRLLFPFLSTLSLALAALVFATTALFVNWKKSFS